MYIKQLLKRQLIYSIVIATGIITTVALTSYALFYTVESNPNDQEVASGELTVNYTGGSTISINNIEPMTDAEAATQSNNLYTFSIENEGSVPYIYNISLIDDPAYLSGGVNYDEDMILLNHQYIRYTLNNIEVNALGSTSEGLIQTGSLQPGEIRNFSLRLWVADAEEYSLPNEALDSEIHISIKVAGQAGQSVPSGWYEAGSETLLAALRTNNPITKTTTIPGRAISTSGEAVLASAPDDYGTSLYFRGAVENNYVVFANMCWRVVRITGDGSIKLVLYNYNPNTIENPCDVSQDGTSYAFARYSGTTYTSAFNSTANRNAYIGFMYGIPGSATYAAEHANTNKSTILTNLETWYTSKLSSYASTFSDIIWCNDKKIDIEYLYGTSLGYGTNQTGYGGDGRIFANWNYTTAARPSLVCPNDSKGGKLSKFTFSDAINGNANLTYKIGLLTVDEIAFAGGVYSVANSTYYIYKNASSDLWWSMTPIFFNGSYASVFGAFSSGSLVNDSTVALGALRPAISLISTVTVIGAGTSANPYVVQ